MVLNIILFVLGAICAGLGVQGIVIKSYDTRKETEYTKESLIKVGLVGNIANICLGVGVILCGLAYNSVFITAMPFMYIFLFFVMIVLLADSILENKLLEKKEK